MSAPESAFPDTNLVNLIIALLTPMFLWATEGDIRLARIAAAQTLNEHRVATRLSLFTVAKMIAFDIATLSSLSQSMYEDISISLGLRLRGNAVSLDRSGERNRSQWEHASRTATPDETGDAVEAAIAEAQRMVQEAKARIEAAAPPPETQPDAEPAAPATPASPSARTPDQQRQAAWANAMTQVAQEFTADLKDLPPEERWKEMARIEALTIAAADLASAAAPLPIGAMAAE
jgi:hypothetical protein